MVKVNLPVLYSQFDDRWAKLLLGFNTDLQYNFYNYACLVTCLAMLCRYYGFDETPATINQKLKDLGPGAGFTGGALYVWGALLKIHPEIAEKLVNVGDVPVSNAQMAEIKTALDAGIPVMVQIDVNPKTVLNDTHYVLLIDYNPNDENDFTIADPLGGRSHSLKDYLGWFRPSARNSIFQYVVYTGKKQDSDVDIMRREWPNVVHGSTEWDKTVAEYKPDKDPKQTQFTDIKQVIGGIRSEATKAKSDLVDVSGKLVIAQQEIENRKEQIANVQAECQRTLDIQKAQYVELEGSFTDDTKLKDSYLGQIKDLQSKLRDAQKESGVLKSQIAGYQAGISKDFKSILVKALKDVLHIK